MLNTPHKDLVRTVFALFLIAHGIAHFVGFGHAWRMLSPDPYPYRTTLVGTQLDVGDAGMRVLGVLWLVVGAGFIAVSGAALLRVNWWMAAAAVMALVSLVLCVLAWPDTSIGLALNVVVVGALFVVGRLSQLAES